MSTYKYPTTGGKSSPKHNRSDSGVGSSSDYDVGYDASSYDHFDNTPSIRDVLRSKQAELDHLKAELKALQAEHKLYIHENKELQSDAKAHGAEIKGLHTENKELKSNNKDLQSANKALQSSNKDLQSSNKDLQSANKALQSSNKDLQSANNKLQREIHEIGTGYYEICNDKEKLAGEVKKLTEKNKKFKKIIEQYDAYLDTIDPEQPVAAIRSSSEPSSPKAAKTQTVKFDKATKDKEPIGHADHRDEVPSNDKQRLSRRFEPRDDKSESSGHSARSADVYLEPVAAPPANQTSASRRQRRPSVVATTTPAYIATSASHPQAHDAAYKVPRTSASMLPASTMKRRQSVSYVQGAYVPFDLPGHRGR